MVRITEDWLRSHRAPEALLKGFPLPADGVEPAWMIAKLERVDWLLWLVHALAAMGRRELLDFACECARPYVDARTPSGKVFAAAEIVLKSDVPATRAAALEAAETLKPHLPKMAEEWGFQTTAAHALATAAGAVEVDIGALQAAVLAAAHAYSAKINVLMVGEEAVKLQAQGWSPYEAAKELYGLNPERPTQESNCEAHRRLCVKLRARAGHRDD